MTLWILFCRMTEKMDMLFTFYAIDHEFTSAIRIQARFDDKFCVGRDFHHNLRLSQSEFHCFTVGAIHACDCEPMRIAEVVPLDA